MVRMCGGQTILGYSAGGHPGIKFWTPVLGNAAKQAAKSTAALIAENRDGHLFLIKKNEETTFQYNFPFTYVPASLSSSRNFHSHFIIDFFLSSFE